MDENLTLFKERVEQYKDDVLLEIVNVNHDEYMPEAIEIVKAELKKRGYEDYSILDEVYMADDNIEENASLKSILMQTRREDIQKALIKLYPSEDRLHAAFNGIFETLVKLKPSEPTGTYIYIARPRNIYNISTMDWEVLGENPDNKDLFDISFYFWADWLSLLTKKEQVTRMGKANYLAHCIHAMTFHGLSEDAVNQEFTKFENLDGTIPEESYNEIVEVKTEEEDKEVHPWLRYWARTIDYMIVSVVIYLLFISVLADFAVPMENIQRYIAIPPFIWTFFEAALLNRWGTTPGKWIFNIHIRDAEGQKLSFVQALNRSFFVWSAGVGFGIIYVNIFTKILSYNRL